MLGLLRENHEGDTTPMRHEPNLHIRDWHHSQPKTLRQWVCESSFLYGAQLSHFYSMWDLELYLDSQKSTPQVWVPPHWYFPLEWKHFKPWAPLTCTAIHLNGIHLPDPLSRRLLIQGLVWAGHYTNLQILYHYWVFR